MPDHHTTTTGPKVHELKCWPPHFEEVLTGRKPFELRRNDRGFEAGDLLELREYDNTVSGSYTGRTCRREITSVLGDGDYGMEPGFVALGLAALAEQDQPALSLGRDAGGRLVRVAAQIDYSLEARSPLDAEAQDDAAFLRDLAKNLGDGGQGEAAADAWPEVEMARVNPSSAPVLASGPEAALAVSEPERETYVPVSLLVDAKFRAGRYLNEWRNVAADLAEVTSTQPVPSHLSEEAVREKLLGEVQAKLGPLLDAIYEVGSIPDTDDVGAPQDIDGPALWRAVDALQREVASLSASSETGGVGELREKLLGRGAEILGRRAYERAMKDLPLVVPGWDEADPQVRAAFTYQAQGDLDHFVLPALEEDR